MRILTMQSPGRRTRSDAHLPFDPASPASYLRRRPANFGDYVVIDSMLKVIDGDVVGNVQLAPPSDAPLPAADHLVIRGANYIRSNFDLSGMGDVIERLGLPVTVMGIGAQAPDYGKLELPKGTIRALRILGEHSNVVGARGAYTAEVLTELGVDNVEPIGCPSFFRAMNRDLAITLDAQAIGSVAYNMNRHMTGIYGSDSLLVNRIQRSFFMELKRSFGVVWTFCQGELPEFIAAHRLEEHYAALKSQLVRSGFANSESDPIIDDLVASAVCATSVTDWEQRISDVDLVIGMRFHGTTVGLSNGVPSIYLVNDTRIHELATHFAVPYVDVRKLDAPPSIDSIVEAADFGPSTPSTPTGSTVLPITSIGMGFPRRCSVGVVLIPNCDTPTRSCPRRQIRTHPGSGSAHNSCGPGDGSRPCRRSSTARRAELSAPAPRRRSHARDRRSAPRWLTRRGCGGGRARLDSRTNL